FSVIDQNNSSAGIEGLLRSVRTDSSCRSVIFSHLVRTGQRIFVSAENNAYCGWQCKLFYASAIAHLNHRPIFIVHDSGEEWHRAFDELTNAGATVRAVPSYARSVADIY